MAMETGEYPSTISPPGFLALHGDLERWIKNNYDSRLLLKMLELVFPTDVKGTKNSIEALPNLTHLFVSNGDKNNCIPNSIKGVEHLCLQWYDSESHSVNLSNLSTLKTLDLITTTFSSEPSLPVSLRCLSLHSLDTFSLPASMAKLTNLRTLELSRCYKLFSLPALNIVTLKIDQIIESLPVGLRHLEIIHVKSDCFDKKCGSHRLEQCLTRLVDLEMLSLTCYDIKSPPSMARQYNLRILLLKDCFALKELPPDMEHLVKLHMLDISGTRIKFLPDSIIKLSMLQQLTLPKGFSQNLPRRLEEVSIIDDTSKSYYEHMGYYESDFETISISPDDYDDDDVGSIEEIDEAITEDPIEGVVDEQAYEQNDVIAQVPTVSRSTMKRGKNDGGIIWPSNKKIKQCHDEKEKVESNSDPNCLEKPSKLADEQDHKVSKGAAATIPTVEKPPLEHVKKSHMEVPQLVEAHLDSVNQSNIAHSIGSSSSFDFVKACYEGDLVWIDFSLTSSFDRLNESVCKKFRVKVNKFKIKYLDEDNEWLLMTCVSDLTHALLHTSASGRKFVRLCITDTDIVKTGRASEENNERLIPNKSEGRSTRMYIHCERENAKNIQCAGENSQPSNRDCISFPEFCAPCIKPLIEGYIDVKADGNCGFRVIATFEYGDEEKWLDVRFDLLKELNSNEDMYKRSLGGDEDFERARFILNWLVCPAAKMHWFDATCLGLVVATKYQKVFTCWSTECCTYLPLVSRLVDNKPPSMYINMARVNGNHFIALQMRANGPLPPLSPLWKWHCCDIVKHWTTKTFKKQLDDYLQLGA